MLDKVVVTDLKTNNTVYFLCGKWLDKKEDDGLIIRELPASGEDGVSLVPLTRYQIAVTTGDRRGAGTGEQLYFFSSYQMPMCKSLCMETPIVERESWKDQAICTREAKPTTLE